jgi:hypothetical protein
MRWAESKLESNLYASQRVSRIFHDECLAAALRRKALVCNSLAACKKASRRL